MRKISVLILLSYISALFAGSSEDSININFKNTETRSISMNNDSTLSGNNNKDINQIKNDNIMKSQENIKKKKINKNWLIVGISCAAVGGISLFFILKNLIARADYSGIPSFMN